MFKDVPVQVWLSLVIATIAFVPARYVYDHLAHDPARRDIGQPPEDLRWRTSGKLGRNLGILGSLLALALFIWTPLATAIARSPSFFPLLSVAFGGFVLFWVARGLATGHIRPAVRGNLGPYQRDTQPKRYWAALSWNLLFGCLFVWGGFKIFTDAPVQALERRCYDGIEGVAEQDAISACTQLLTTAGDDRPAKAGALDARGSAYFRAGDFQRARTDYENAVRLDPQRSASQYNLGLVNERLGERERALINYGAAISADPENADAFVNRGIIYLDTRRFEQAVADFTRAIALKPHDPIPLANRGIGYAWMNDVANAEQDFAAAQAIDPDKTIVVRGKALVSVAQGDLPAAVGYLNKALAADAGDRWSLAMRAKIYGMMGKGDLARADTEALERVRAGDKMGGR